MQNIVNYALIWSAKSLRDKIGNKIPKKTVPHKSPIIAEYIYTI